MRIRIKDKYIDSKVILYMIALFSFLKIYRNSINYSESTQGGIWNIILLSLVFYCFSFILVSIISKNNVSTIIVAIIYASVIWINGMVTMNIVGVKGIYYYLVAPCFVPVFIFFYRVSLNGDDVATPLWDLIWIINFILLLYTLIKFFGSYSYYESGKQIALNNSYYAACVIPFFIRKRNKFGKFMVGLALLIIFISNKRAGIIGTVLALVLYYLVNAKLSDSLNKALKRLFVGFIVCIVIYIFCVRLDSYYHLSVISRLYKILDDGGSGRSTIYKYVLDEISNSSIVSWLFGHGVSSINDMERSLSSAHNDFINVFYEYGFFAAFFLVIFYFSLIKCTVNMIRSKYINSDVFAFSVMISLVLSMFSANLDNQSFSIVIASYWGTELGNWKKQINDSRG